MCFSFTISIRYTTVYSVHWYVYYVLCDCVTVCRFSFSLTKRAGFFCSLIFTHSIKLFVLLLHNTCIIGIVIYSLPLGAANGSHHTHTHTQIHRSCISELARGNQYPCNQIIHTTKSNSIYDDFLIIVIIVAVHHCNCDGHVRNALTRLPLPHIHSHIRLTLIESPSCYLIHWYGYDFV